jgi:ADP-heptose:LPS heptosyltransferase
LSAPAGLKPILVTKINFLGDAVVFLPALRALREELPGRPLVVVCTEVGRQVFEGSIPDLKPIVVDYRRVRSVRGLAAELLRTSWCLGRRSVGLSLHSYDEPTFSYLLALFAGASRRIGFDSCIARGQRLLTETIPFRRDLNVVELNFELVRYLTANPHLMPRRVPIAYSRHDLALVRSHLSTLGIGNLRSFAVVHPGAKLEYKQWGTLNFKSLAAAVEAELGIPVVFVLEAAGPDPAWPRTLTGLSVKQLAALLHQASIFIGNNSGPMNIAAAMGTPCVVIQGPSPPNWEIFWKDVPHVILKATHLPCLPCERLGRVPGRCLNRDYPHGCMREVTVEMVLDAVKSLMPR